MERRTILAIILIMIVAVLPSMLFRPATPTGTAGRRDGGTAAPDSAAATSIAGRPASELPVLTDPTSAVPPSRRPADPVVPVDLSERLVNVESGLYRYTFSTRGARLVGATIKNFRSFAPG